MQIYGVSSASTTEADILPLESSKESLFACALHAPDGVGYLEAIYGEARTAHPLYLLGLRDQSSAPSSLL